MWLSELYDIILHPVFSFFTIYQGQYILILQCERYLFINVICFNVDKYTVYTYFKYIILFFEILEMPVYVYVWYIYVWSKSAFLLHFCNRVYLLC